MDLKGLALHMKLIQIIVRKVTFYKRLYFKSGFLHDVFWAALLSDRSDDCLRSVFYPFECSD